MRRQNRGATRSGCHSGSGAWPALPTLTLRASAERKKKKKLKKTFFMGEGVTSRARVFSGEKGGGGPPRSRFTGWPHRSRPVGICCCCYYCSHSAKRHFTDAPPTNTSRRPAKAAAHSPCLFFQPRLALPQRCLALSHAPHRANRSTRSTCLT